MTKMFKYSVKSSGVYTNIMGVRISCLKYLQGIQFVVVCVKPHRTSKRLVNTSFTVNNFLNSCLVLTMKRSASVIQ